MEKTRKYSEVLNNNIQAIRSVVAAVRGTIGPKGMDVMLIDELGNFVCTNDGVEILSNIQINHPAAKLAIEAAKSQETKVGDGTTTAAILCDSLLASALIRINTGIRPARIVKGIEIGIEAVIKELKASAKQIKNANDPKLQSIVAIAARGDADITSMIIEAAKRSEAHNLESDFDLANSIIAASGLESRVIDGLFIKKKTHFNYSETIEKPAILLIEGSFDPEPIPSEAISTDEGVKKFEQNIQALMEAAKRIAKTGIKAVLTSSSMLPIVEEFFAKEGIFVLTHLKKSDINSLINISGAKLVTRTTVININEERIKELSGQLKIIKYQAELAGFVLEGAKAYQASIVIGAETETRLEECKRIATDAAKALMVALRSGYVLGEGVAEMNIADAVERLRETYADDKDISAGIEVVVESLKSVFLQIIENAGFAFNDLYYKIRFGPKNLMGINLENGEALDLEAAGIIDPLELKVSAFKIASEIASQIIRVNMIVQAK